MANSVDLTPPVPRILEVSAETKAEWKAVRAAVCDWRFWLKVAIIIAAPIWIYSPVFHGGWLMDDNFYLENNPLLNDPDRLWKAWFEPGSFVEYYPIHESLQWAQWKLWGQDTFGYHLTNILLHAFSSLLIWRLLSKFRLTWAWVGGLLFAVHPTLVESVVWIAELKNTLSLPPFLIAMCFYVEYENHRRPRDYYFAIASYVIAMFCKISMTPFPALILLYAWWRRGRIERRDIRDSLPFWAIAFCLMLLGTWCGSVFADEHRMDITFTSGGSAFRIAILGQTLAFYLATCLWPFGLQPMYVRWPLEHPTLLQFLPYPIVLAAAYWFWKNRSTWGRHAILGFGFFGLFIAPFLGFFIISYMRLTWVMDHFVYIAVIGLIGLAVAALESLSNRFSFTGRILLRVAVVSTLMELMLSAHWYAAKFADQRTLWTYAIAENPKAYTAYNNLGAIILKDGRNEEALRLFDKAIQYYPDYFEAHYNRAIVLGQLNRFDEAMEEYKKSSELSPKNLEARLMYAQALNSNGHLYDAIHEYEIAVQENPGDPHLHAEVGALLVQAGRAEDAVREFGEAVRLDPRTATTHNDLGNVLFMAGQRNEAMDEYREAIRLDPKLVEAHNNLGGALQETGHLDQAIEQFQTAVNLQPDNPKLNLNLAIALAKAGHQREALLYAEQAVHYAPTSKPARQLFDSLRGEPAPKPPAKP